MGWFDQMGGPRKGYYPMRKLQVIVSGLRYAFADVSVLYKTLRPSGAPQKAPSQRPKA